MAFFGTLFGHIVMQVVVGAASAGVQAATHTDFGSWNGLVQAGAALVTELIPIFGGQATPTASAPAK